MKTLFTMIFALATFFLPYMKVYPFELSQMNLVEIFVIGVPSFVLSLQPNDDRLQGNFISYVLNKCLPSALLMVLSVAFIEIFKKTLGTMPEEIYTTMQVFALTFAGLISLIMICKPLNKLRTALVLFSSAILITVAGITVFNGLPMLNLYKLTPLKDYWHHLLLLIAIILVDFPLLSLLKKFCKKINIQFNKQK